MRSKCISILAGLILVSCSTDSTKTPDKTTSSDTITADSIKTPLPQKGDCPLGAQVLMEVYPSQIAKYSNNEIYFSDGKRIVYDDKKKKDFVQKLDSPDVEDMFGIEYSTNEVPSYLADGGRCRSEELFMKMYGHNASEVAKNLVSVEWFGNKVKFTKINGAADSLKIVAEEVAKKYPKLVDYMKPGMTVYWRKVRGANRLSAHSFGIAIDINVAKSDYWLWANPNKSETDIIKYKNRIPIEIVKVFEAHGFIWGGRWYHFDTMHFEFRPEIIRYSQKKK